MRTDPTKDLGPILTLEQAIDRDSRSYRGGLTAVCAVLGEEYNAFQKRLSFSYPDHHLYVRDFERWLELVDCPHTLRTIARIKGGLFFYPRKVNANRKAIKGLSELLACESEFVASLHDGLEDDVWEKHEVETLEEHGHRVIEKILGIMAGARQAMEVPDDD